MQLIRRLVLSRQWSCLGVALVPALAVAMWSLLAQSLPIQCLCISQPHNPMMLCQPGCPLNVAAYPLGKADKGWIAVRVWILPRATGRPARLVQWCFRSNLQGVESAFLSDLPSTAGRVLSSDGEEISWE